MLSERGGEARVAQSHGGRGNQAMRWIPKNEIAERESGSIQNSKRLGGSSEEFQPRRKPKEDPGPRPNLVFLPYLPQDECGGDALELQEVTDHLNRELCVLLKLKPQDFTREVLENDSLHELLESYLHFRTRWFSLKGSGRVVVGDDELYRRVFMVLLRMSADEEPGTLASIVRNKKVFELPTIMEICVIYGHDNPQLSRKLVTRLLDSEPVLLRSLPEVVSRISKTIYTICERTVKMLERSKTADGKVNDELSEVVEFLIDTVKTLEAFFEIYPAAARHLVSDFKLEKNLLSAIATVHNLLLPSLRKHFIVESTLESLQAGLVILAWLPLSTCFFDDANAASPDVLGELLVQALLSLSSASNNNQPEMSIVQCLSNRFDLPGKAYKLIENGSITLDDGVFAQVLSLLPETGSIPREEPTRSTPVQHETEQEEAIRLSHIFQIKDLFPDYGDGFISACLEVYDNNPEVVIQHILEGSVHPELSKLDPALQHQPDLKNKSQAQPLSKDKGKAKVFDEGSSKIPTGTTTTTATQGRFIRRSQNPGDEDAIKLLEQGDSGSTTQTARLAMQLMYEDEYDDSFDELDANVGDAGLETDSLVNLVSRKKQPGSGEDDEKPGGISGKWKTKGTPRFYLKDGKNYSYKVAGSVPVASVEEAEAMKRQEKGLIHGLGAGGNVPLHSLSLRDEEQNDEEEVEEGSGDEVQQVQPAGFGRGRGWGRGRGQGPGQGSGRGSGRGRGRGGHSHNRKEGALKKHLAGL